MTTSKLPALTSEIIVNKSALKKAVNAALDTPRLQESTRKVLRLQRRLRALLNGEQWRAYMLLEEAVNDRIAEESLVIVRWAWAEGRRRGPVKGSRR